MTRYTWIIATSVNARLVYWCRLMSHSCPCVPKIGNMLSTIDRLTGTTKNIASQKVSFQPKSAVSAEAVFFRHNRLAKLRRSSSFRAALVSPRDGDHPGTNDEHRGKANVQHEGVAVSFAPQITFARRTR